MCGCHVRPEALKQRKAKQSGKIRYELNLECEGGALLRPIEIAVAQGTTQERSRTPARERAADTQSTPLLEHYRSEAKTREKTVQSLTKKLDERDDLIKQLQGGIARLELEKEELLYELRGANDEIIRLSAQHAANHDIWELELLARRQAETLQRSSNDVRLPSEKQRRDMYTAARMRIKRGTWEYTFACVRSVCDAAGASDFFKGEVASLPVVLQKQDR